MRRQCLFALRAHSRATPGVLGALAAGIASPQTAPPSVISYLSLTAPQYQPIKTLDIAFNAFNEYKDNQEQQYYDLAFNCMSVCRALAGDAAFLVASSWLERKKLSHGETGRKLRLENTGITSEVRASWSLGDD